MLHELAGLTIDTRDPTTEQRRPLPILFIHGMWEGGWLWENYLDVLSGQGYRCHALYLRGHDPARPDPNLGKLTIQRYIADVRAVAAELGNPILIGHSMGGLIVQKLAELTDPPAAVTIAPAAPRGIFALNTWALLRISVRHSPEIFGGRPLMLSQAEMNALLLNRLPPAEQTRVYAKLVPESGRQTFDIAVAGLPVAAERVRCPLLVLGATDDQITPAKMVRKIARKYSATYREYRGHAHMLMIEQGWREIASEVVEWLEAQKLDAPVQ
jgi:pimeloyl-ACP methyl ester carboxylesterase